jgi:GalNAc5-diNAcBac-PP-undecaprenol beta-1,3-glucosyltransferase
MTLRATVLIPTFDHGPTLLRSVPSALRQTVEDLEVFVVGDGAPDVTREVMADLVRSDDRVRFFDNPKGPRHGEVLRHAAIQEARGRVVCYLSDDDLWAPDHVETLSACLEEADLAHSLVAAVLPDQTWLLGRIDLSLEWYRHQLLAGIGHLPLSTVGHTLEAYRRLSHGWRTTPPGIATDVYMWRQFLADPACRASSAYRLTVYNFASAERPDWSIEERVEELDRWIAAMAEPGWQERALADLLSETSRDRLAVWSLYEDARGFLRKSQNEFDTVTGTRTWRLRQRLLSSPTVRALLRSAGRARRRPARP